jgi:hypothetical protein
MIWRTNSCVRLHTPDVPLNVLPKRVEARNLGCRFTPVAL